MVVLASPESEPATGVRWLFSRGHKAVGLRYGLTALSFLFVGFSLMVMMRWQLAFPGEQLPLAGILGENRAPGGIMAPEFYNQLTAMHGTIMVFLAVVPLLIGAFGNYLVPLMVGASDVAFPRLNGLSYWLYLAGGLVMLSSFFAPGGAADAGWTSYPPLSTIASVGQTMWLFGMVFIILSSLLGSINIIATIVQLRTEGLSLLRLPFFVWAQLVSAFLLLLAFPALHAASILQLMDRLTGSSFFLPSGLVVAGEIAPQTGGGSPLLWQHLFWFLAHPEVYVLILPALGIVTEVITTHARRPLWGYGWAVGSAAGIGFVSFLVWAHHMFLTGMGTVMSTFFQATTMIISIPSVIILSCLLLTLWGGSIRFPTPMLFALAFLPMFGLGGLTGLPLGLAAANLQLHDTYYVVGHFHYIVAPGTLFGVFAGIYHWFPKLTGKHLGETLGKLHFWPTLLLMNGVFFPMFILGLAGVSRRLYDGGAGFAFAREVVGLNQLMSFSAWGLGLAQIPFLINLVLTLRRKPESSPDANPWNATTLEWCASSPPPSQNFSSTPTVLRAPYQYEADAFQPQWAASSTTSSASGSTP